MTTYTINNELNGIEIKFDERPGEMVLASLKASGFRWHGKKRLWYAKDTAECRNLAIALAKRAAVGEIVRKEGEQKEKATALTIEKMNRIAEGYTFEQTGEGIYTGWTGCNADKPYKYDEDALKKAILAELKKTASRPRREKAAAAGRLLLILPSQSPRNS